MAGIHFKVRRFALISLFSIWISGCSALVVPDLPTPLPQEHLPTIIALTSQALTSQADRTDQPAAAQRSTPIPVTPNPTPEEATALPVTPTATLEAPATASVEILEVPTLPALEATAVTAPFIPPDIPNNLIEIHNLGPLSRVVSPIHLYAYLKTGAGSQARIELLGEDHRLLFGETKVFNVPENARVVLSMDINFEIAAPAETGRLQLYTQDAYGRVTAFNSVPLILFSLGDSDISAPIDVLDPISIQQPVPKALIQGGTLLATGMARASSGSTLLARLIAEDGREVGMRLANVAGSSTEPDAQLPEGGYNSFTVEVPYQVSEPTPALLVVSIGEADNTDIIHLSSVEVLLSP